MFSKFVLTRVSKRICHTFSRYASRQSGKKGKKAAADNESGDRLKEMMPPPEFLAERQLLWDQLKKEADEQLAAMPSEPIKITLPDGKVVEGQSWRTTPYEVAKGISQGLADNCVVAKVNDVTWDLDRPFESDATLQLLKFDDKEGEYVFWHSSAHILGEAMERLYGGHLCYGPPIEGGFYYDMWSERRYVTTYNTLIQSPKDKTHQPHLNSSTYWEGKADAENLQRIYGISFPDTKQLKEWKHFQEEAAKRDHRKLGRVGCGNVYLIQGNDTDTKRRGFWDSWYPPTVYYLLDLGDWSVSWLNSTMDNMFQFEVDKEKFALKPMNCPGHCLMFDVRPRSWKELPVRMADFGVLHRNELKGALSGLTRVRRFQQDDAHIFCRPDQIKEEISGCLDFLKHVYGVFGFTFKLNLSTRPEKYMGEIAVWDEAEKHLAECLDEFGQGWELNPQDGAFYGPKIDITIMDALKRSHQCATIQLDFQLPLRFNLSYVTGEDASDKKRPVIIHRAVLGSVERMIAILCESYSGKWPFWLSPRQAVVIPVAPLYNDYANQVKQQIQCAGFMCDTDVDEGTTLNKKVRNCQLSQYNFILVVGEKEVTNKTANVRTRDNKVHGEHTIDDIVTRFQALKTSQCIDAEEKF
ncbi:threonine--tRNA ligase 1, cytoplasmic-like [Argopecten irradians]|uniref:threonine--tRNA ligase 1, cytoplasmic-like n=1 Tax=Argopecten irradians TaxID=31199 RepID=UPI0037122B74